MSGGNDPGERDDAELVRRARDGDSGAFARLVGRYQRALTSWAIARCRNLEDADDLVQETFLRAFRGLRRFRDDSRFGPWLFRILANLAADRARRSGREVAWSETDSASYAEPGDGPEDQVLASEIRRALERSLEELPPGRQREVFRMRFVEGMAVREIAGRLGVHSGTVKVHLFRLARRLRGKLNEEGSKA